MQAYDWAMLAIVATATLWGFWKGLAWQLASLAAIFVSYYVAYHYADAAAPWISATPPWNKFLAMLLLYAATSLAIWLAFGAVSRWIERVRLREFDRQVGALFGLAAGVLICLLTTFFAVTLMGEQLRASICRSRSGYFLALLLDRADAVMPEELHEVLHPYVRKLDQQLRGGALGPGPADGEGEPPAAPPARDSRFGGPAPAPRR